LRLRRKATRALTLVEIMVAILIGAIVLIATTIALAGVYKMIIQARDHSLVREDILVATRFIRSSIRACAPEEVSIGDQGATLTISPAGGPVTSIKKAEMNLVRQSGGESMILIRNRLADLKFEVVPGHAAETTLLKATLTVAVNEVSSTASFTTGFRNKLES